MDRIDAMKVFVAALDEGSLAGAGRKLGKSPAAVSRAIAFLEARVGTNLLHRTTRSIKLSEAGERYSAVCRRVLIDLEKADMTAAGERAAQRGTLTITAPVVAGEDLVRPILDAFMDTYPAVSTRLHLLDRPVNLIDEGIDIALRIAHLADSTLVAIPAGDVRRVVAASPRYLSQHPVIRQLADLAKHHIIAMTHFGHRLLELPAARRLLDSTLGAVHAEIRRQQHSCGRGLGSPGPRRGSRVLVSHRPAAGSEGAGVVARRRRAPAPARSSGFPARPAVGSEGACFRGLRAAAAARRLCALGSGGRPFRRRHSTARSKSLCRLTGIRSSVAEK
jgi:DNA-binding transcriptional LysR family regulator